jgi:hypothetical protein
MNDIDQWEQEEAARQQAKIQQEDAQYAALPEAEKQRKNEEQLLYLEQFENLAQDESE